MSRVSTFERVKKEALGAVPRYIDILTDNYNSQIEELTATLQRGISYSDQFNSQVITSTVEDGVEYEFKLKDIRGKPSRVTLDWTSHFSPWRLCWAIVDQARIKIIVKWDTAPTEAATIKITVTGETS